MHTNGGEVKRCMCAVYIGGRDTERLGYRHFRPYASMPTFGEFFLYKISLNLKFFLHKVKPG